MGSRVVIAALAFAAGGVVGALALRWYIQTHPLTTVGAATVDKIFGEGSKTGTTIKGLLSGLEAGTA